MKKPKELKVLVFTMKTGLKRKIFDLLEGKIIRLTFSDTQEPSKVSKRVLLAYDSFCIAAPTSDTKVTIFVQTYNGIERSPQKRSAK